MPSGDSLGKVSSYRTDAKIPNVFRFASTLTSSGDEMALRDCMPLFGLTVKTNRWWSRNLSMLFDGPLRSYISLDPGMVLKEHKVILMMEKSDKPNHHPIIRYTTDEPIRLKEEFVDYYKRYSVSKRLDLFAALWAALVCAARI